MSGLQLSALLVVGTLVVSAFVVVAALTGPFARWLGTRQIGKAIREDGPDHASKAGTPTMGGLVLLATLVGLGLTIERASGLVRDAGTGLWLAVVALLFFAIPGAIDDWSGLMRKGQVREIGIGLSAKQMIVLQTLGALLLAWLCLRFAPSSAPLGDGWTGEAYLPAVIAARSAILWYLVATLAIVGTVNGANLSDGLDGLAIGLLAIAFAAYGLVLWRAGWMAEAAYTLCACSACLGFLVWNRHPARVFMGNVTSMALGATLAVLALVSGSWPLLPIIGAVFVAEVLSDILQVGYFKASGGKRIFRMAPIHHHFELGGWSETKVVTRFWSAGLLAALIGISLTWL